MAVVPETPIQVDGGFMKEAPCLRCGKPTEFGFCSPACLLARPLRWLKKVMEAEQQ